MLIKVGGDQYESLETKKLVGQFSGLHIGPQWPRPLPYMVREALDFKISNFTLLRHDFGLHRGSVTRENVSCT